MDEKKDGEEKGGKHFVKENIWKANEMRNGEKKGNIWRRKIYICRGEEEWRGKMKNVMREGKYFLV